MISPNELNRGLFIKLDGNLFVVEECQLFKPGKGGSLMRTKLRNLQLDTIIERTFREVEKIEDIFVEEKELQYQYHSGDSYHFMDQESFEEIAINKETLGHTVNYLKDNMVLSAVTYEGRIITVKCPLFVTLKVVSTEPGIRGDTSKSGNKPAELETGLVIQVPLFIETGNTLKIDTRTGGYVERA